MTLEKKKKKEKAMNCSQQDRIGYTVLKVLQEW